MKKKPCWSALPRQPKFWTTRDECGPCCSRRSQQSSGAGTFSVPLVSPLTRSLPTRPDTERSQTQQWRSKGSQIREFTTPFKQTQKKEKKKKGTGEQTPLSFELDAKMRSMATTMLWVFASSTEAVFFLSFGSFLKEYSITMRKRQRSREKKGKSHCSLSTCSLASWETHWSACNWKNHSLLFQKRRKKIKTRQLTSFQEFRR